MEKLTNLIKFIRATGVKVTSLTIAQEDYQKILFEQDIQYTAKREEGDKEHLLYLGVKIYCDAT